MKIESVKLVYFSPTGTSKAVVQGIARGINPRIVEFIDITLPEAREQPLVCYEDELLIVAVPVYMGRVPAVATDWLNRIQADKTPTVCVVVYGNRAFENALRELKDIVTGCGGIPIAGAAYIGEHSFATAEAPIALGRPDRDDLEHAEEFGRKIREKLQSISPITQVPCVEVPGTFPYEGVTKLWDVDFIEVSDLCEDCGVCAEVCPVGAIDSEKSSTIDHVKCITCCACIKACPQGARSIKPSKVKDAQTRLFTNCKEPKQPEYFL